MLVICDTSQKYANCSFRKEQKFRIFIVVLFFKRFVLCMYVKIKRNPELSTFFNKKNICMQFSIEKSSHGRSLKTEIIKVKICGIRNINVMLFQMQSVFARLFFT